MTETAPVDDASAIVIDVIDQITDLTLQMQTYLAEDPDPRVTDLLTCAVEIIDGLLEQLIELDARLETLYPPAMLC